MQSFISFVCVLFIINTIGNAIAHSWVDNPPGRFPNVQGQYCLKNDDGTLYRDDKGSTICDKDAQGINLPFLRPDTYRENPCYFPSGYNWAGQANSVVEENGILCATWSSNSHNTEQDRNARGGVRFAVSKKLVNITQNDFDSMIIAKNIPYENFGGVKIQLPPLPAGDYVLQFYWDWPTPNAHNIFGSCADFSIVPKGDARLSSQSELGMGLPKGFQPPKAAADWHCDAASPIWGNTSLSGPTATSTASVSATTSATASSTIATTTSSASSTGASTTSAASSTAATTTSTASTTAATSTSTASTTAATTASIAATTSSIASTATATTTSTLASTTSTAATTAATTTSTAATTTSTAATTASTTSGVASTSAASTTATASTSGAAGATIPPPLPGGSGSTSVRVVNSVQLEQALAEGYRTITVAPGTYLAPDNGFGFKVNASNVLVQAEIPGESVIICRTQNDYGLNVQGFASYIYGLSVQRCSTGVYVTSTKAVFNSVTISNNQNNIGLGSGIHAIVGSVIYVVDSFITNNIGFAGIYCYGTVTISNTTISNNSGGGITARYNAKVTLQKSIVQCNKGSGIFASEESNIVVTDSKIASNWGAYYGGGIGAINSFVTLTNTVVWNNTATRQAGGIYVDSSFPVSVTINGGTLTGNSAPGEDSGILFPANNYVTLKANAVTMSNNGAKTFCCNGYEKKTFVAEVCTYPSNCSS